MGALDSDLQVNGGSAPNLWHNNVLNKFLRFASSLKVRRNGKLSICSGSTGDRVFAIRKRYPSGLSTDGYTFPGRVGCRWVTVSTAISR